jgi:ornithine--oxo-acid transaminase
MNSHDYIALEGKYGANNYHPLDVVLTKGEGVWVYDVEGRAGREINSHVPGIPQRSTSPVIQRVGGNDRL